MASGDVNSLAQATTTSPTSTSVLRSSYAGGGGGGTAGNAVRELLTPVAPAL